MVELGKKLTQMAKLPRSGITQTVIGTPGVFDDDDDTIRLAGSLSGWELPSVCAIFEMRSGRT